MIPIFPEKYFNSENLNVLGISGEFPYYSPPFLGENSFVLLFPVAVGPKSRISTKFKLRVVGDVVNLLGSSYQSGTLYTHDRVQGLKAGKVDRYFLFNKKKHPEKKTHRTVVGGSFFSHLEGLKIRNFFQKNHDEKNTNPIHNKKVNLHRSTYANV